MTEPVDFHPLLIAVRPARVAVRMGRYEGWEHSALRIVEVLSVTWGGARNIVVSSSDDGLSDDQLWAAVELYDPDFWASHVPTFRGFRLRDPEAYEEFVDRGAREFADQSGNDLDLARQQIDDLYMSHGAINSWTPPAAFWERARQRLAPYWDREYGHPEMISDDELPSGLLVDVTQLGPLPDQVLVPKTDDLPLRPAS